MCRGIGVANAPRAFGRRMRLQPACVHRESDEGFFLTSRGITLAAAMVPIPLTPMASHPSSLIGGTCRYGSSLIRLDSFTTSGQRSYNCRFQNTASSYSTRCTRSPGGLPASCRSARSASPSSRHLHQFAPRRHPFVDVPAHHLDHPNPSSFLIPDSVLHAASARSPQSGFGAKPLRYAILYAGRQHYLYSMINGCPLKYRTGCAARILPREYRRHRTRTPAPGRPCLRMPTVFGDAKVSYCNGS